MRSSGRIRIERQNKKNILVEFQKKNDNWVLKKKIDSNNWVVKKKLL